MKHAVAVALLGLTSARCGGGPSLPTTTLQVGGAPLLVEIADDASERARGLMFRDHLPGEQGMVFVYPDEQIRGFWMKDTRVPLSIAFVDATGRILNIEDLQPLDTTSRKSVGPARFAIEVNRGWFEAKGVAAGARVEGLAALTGK